LREQQLRRQAADGFGSGFGGAGLRLRQRPRAAAVLTFFLIF